MDSIFVCENGGSFNHIMPRVNERIYLSIVQLFISPLGALVLIWGCLFLARNLIIHKSHSFAAVLQEVLLSLTKIKSIFEEILHSQIVQSSALSFSDMQAFAKAGKIICFVHELARTIAKTP